MVPAPATGAGFARRNCGRADSPSSLRTRDSGLRTSSRTPHRLTALDGLTNHPRLGAALLDRRAALHRWTNRLANRGRLTHGHRRANLHRRGHRQGRSHRNRRRSSHDRLGRRGHDRRSHRYRRRSSHQGGQHRILLLMAAKMILQPGVLLVFALQQCLATLASHQARKRRQSQHEEQKFVHDKTHKAFGQSEVQEAGKSARQIEAGQFGAAIGRRQRQGTATVECRRYATLPHAS